MIVFKWRCLGKTYLDRGDRDDGVFGERPKERLQWGEEELIHSLESEVEFIHHMPFLQLFICSMNINKESVI